jgi:hypothetical protein
VQALYDADLIGVDVAALAVRLKRVTDRLSAGVDAWKLPTARS